MSKLDKEVIYKKLDFFIVSLCDQVPIERTKGTFFYDQFKNFLSTEGFKLNIKDFYDILRTWIEKNPQCRINEKKYGNSIYLEGIIVRSKSDDSIQKYNNYMKNKVKEIRHNKILENGGIVIEKPRKGNNIIKLYTVIKDLPKDVTEWDQHQITIENFEKWYRDFLDKIDPHDPYDAYEILNNAINNFRHAKELKPRNFRRREYDTLLLNVTDKLDFLDSLINKKIHLNQIVGQGLRPGAKLQHTDKSEDEVFDELKRSMHKLMIEEHSEFLSQIIKNSNDEEISLWVNQVYPEEDYDKRKLRKEIIESRIIGDEIIRRENYKMI